MSNFKTTDYCDYRACDCHSVKTLKNLKEFPVSLGPDAVVNPWLEEFWEKTLLLFPLPKGLIPLDKKLLLPSKYSIQIISEEDWNQDNDSVYILDEEPLLCISH